MLRGLNAAAAGMIASQRRHDTVTNNIANINTPGYKANVAVQRSFPEMLIHLAGGGAGAMARRGAIGRMHTGVFMEEAPMSFMQGGLMETRNMSDFAIVSDIRLPGIEFDGYGRGVAPEGEIVFQPQAMFAVRTAEGEERYTRNGKFSTDALGQLVTSEGHLVLDSQRRPIVLDAGEAEVMVTPEGVLINGVTGAPLLDEDGQPLALGIVRIDNPNRLIREGNGNFRLPEGDGLPPMAAPAEGFQVYQGFIERSNVDPVQATVDLMTAARAYESNQRIVQYLDRTLEKAVNEVGRV